MISLLDYHSSQYLHFIPLVSIILHLLDILKTNLSLIKARYLFLLNSPLYSSTRFPSRSCDALYFPTYIIHYFSKSKHCSSLTKQYKTGTKQLSSLSASSIALLSLPNHSPTTLTKFYTPLKID